MRVFFFFLIPASDLHFLFEQICLLSIVTAIVIMQFRHGLRFLLISSVVEVNSGMGYYVISYLV